MYTAAADPYCYAGTTVLKNRLNLTLQDDLDAFEHEIVSQRAEEPLPSGRLSYTHYRSLHRHLFQDVYDWAGKIRTVRISKDGSAFCYPEHIDREMRALFGALAARQRFRGLDTSEFAAQASHFLAELNAIHPFREGNGRAQLSFFTVLALSAGHAVAFDRVKPRTILDVMISSFKGNEDRLRTIVLEVISRSSPDLTKH